MIFRVLFEAEAEAELNEAIAWYDRQATGLGQRFASVVRTALRVAAKNPQRFRLVGPTTRKLKILGWPYSVYFTLLEESSDLIVVSVFHGRRNPAELRQRLR